MKAVIFDFGNVISTFDPTIFVRELSPFSTRAPRDIAAILMNSPGLFIAYETGRMTSEEFFENLREQCSLTCSVPQFVAAFNAIFTPNLPMHDLVRTLKPSFRLGLLSNTSEWHFQHGILPSPVYPLFDTVTLSYEVGAMKPDEAIYRDALGKLGLPPGDCVYIDDIERFVDAARRIGMHGIHYTDHAKLLRELEQLGIITGRD